MAFLSPLTASARRLCAKLLLPDPSHRNWLGMAVKGTRFAFTAPQEPYTRGLNFKDRTLPVMHLTENAFKRHAVPKGHYRLWVFTGDRLHGFFPRHCYHCAETAPAYPCFSFWNRTEAGLDFERDTRALARAGSKPPAVNKLFWIGNINMHPARRRLYALGQKRPDILDIRQYPASRDKTRFVSLPDHCRYRLLIDVRGIAYSGRRKYLFYAMRPLLLVEDKYREFWRQGLKPMEHYVPIRRDLSDLIPKTEMLLADDALCRRLAMNAFAYAQKHITRDAAYRQIVRVFEHARDRAPWWDTWLGERLMP